MTPSRPNFERPPLVEQAISVVFEPIAGFRIVDYGLFWQEIAGDFPEVSVGPPYETTVEDLGSSKPRQGSLRFHHSPPLPRAMFRNPLNGELVQIQRDRFGFNWAKIGDQQYPRSEPLMERFQELLERFSSYVESHGIGELQLRQCELTNLNVLPVSEFGRSYADLSGALLIDPIDFNIPFLVPEAVERSRQHKILGKNDEPVGRLHMAVAPVISNVDNSEAYRFELTARSAPNVASVSQAIDFLGVARAAINSAFIASVTDEMRGRWGEKNVR